MYSTVHFEKSSLIHPPPSDYGKVWGLPFLLFCLPLSVCVSVCLSICFACRSICLSCLLVCLPVCRSSCLLVWCPSACLSEWLFSLCLSVRLSVISLSTCLSRPVSLSICLSVRLTLSVWLSSCPASLLVYLFVFLSVYLCLMYTASLLVPICMNACCQCVQIPVEPLAVSSSDTISTCIQYSIVAYLGCYSTAVCMLCMLDLCISGIG
jgi:hypothetical protein